MEEDKQKAYSRLSAVPASVKLVWWKWGGGALGLELLLSGGAGLSIITTQTKAQTEMEENRGRR